ncbi:MAG: hypothetical protein LIO54_08410 [Oscillospiraceae bacterium]|nr:hypothetical protein [Oscillospiraceae bacterium]
MTLHQVADQLFNLSVAGYFNGEKFTRERLYAHLKCFLRPEVGNAMIMTISLPDGVWYFKVNHYGKGADEYDYDLPETREQERRIKHLLYTSE